MPRQPGQKRTTDEDGTRRVHGKAANGEGSVYFDNGRWRATYRVAGEARSRSVSAPTREQAIERRKQRIEELGPTVLATDMSPSISIGRLAQWWLDNVQRHQVRPSTWTKAEDRVRRIVATIGSIQVRRLRVEHVIAWQSELLQSLAPKTVVHHRQTLAQVIDAAIDLGLVSTNPVRRVKPPRVPESKGRALSVNEVRALVASASEERYGGVVALLFLQGWRVSEALGLAWGDVDLDAGTAVVRRGCVYIDGFGPALGPTKTRGAMGEHQLVPTVVEFLRRRRAAQAAERLTAGTAWQTHMYNGSEVDLVFTRPNGGLVLRQHITKAIAVAARKAAIDPDRLGTHTGRRSVVTALYADAGESLEEIARYVGHASAATTAGYVKDLGTRPVAFARRAADLLDPAAVTAP